MQPTLEGLIYRPGMFVDAIESGRWLVIDEMNRSNFDRAFGQLFTVLSGSAVVLPFKRAGQSRRISIVPFGEEAPAGTDAIRVPSSWRIIATMNAFDKNLLYDMSYALMRRFAFIEVGTPTDATFETLLDGPGDIVKKLLPLRRFVDLGPAVFIDASRYAERRLRDDISRSRVLFEAFYAYFLPQLDGMDLSGRTAAIFGLGDQKKYPDEFVDAIGLLHESWVDGNYQLYFVRFRLDAFFAARRTVARIDGDIVVGALPLHLDAAHAVARYGVAALGEGLSGEGK